MKFAEWMGGTIAIAGLAMTVQTANAQNCDYYRNSTCVVDTVDIYGTNYPPDYGQYDPYAFVYTGGGGGSNTNTPTIGDIARSIYERVEIVCQMQNEPPLVWSARAQRECRADVTLGLNRELPLATRSGIAINAAATIVCGPIVADKAPNGGKPC
jgi:hypothetical protein